MALIPVRLNSPGSMGARANAGFPSTTCSPPPVSLLEPGDALSGLPPYRALDGDVPTLVAPLPNLYRTWVAILSQIEPRHISRLLEDDKHSESRKQRAHNTVDAGNFDRYQTVTKRAPIKTCRCS